MKSNSPMIDTNSLKTPKISIIGENKMSPLVD